MAIHFTANSLYSIIKYQLLSCILSGRKKQKYERKLNELKIFLSGAREDRFFILGVNLITIISFEGFWFLKILGFPIVSKHYYNSGYCIRIFGINIFKNKIKNGIYYKRNNNIIPENYITYYQSNEKLSSLSNNEKSIYHIIEALRIIGD